MSKKISELTDGVVLLPTDVVPIVRSGNTLKSVVQGVYTWAGKPSPVTYSGATILISDLGGPSGSLWRSDGTNWNPLARTRIATNTALITGLNQLADQVVISLAIPTAVLVAGRVFDIYLSLGKSGTTDAYGTTTLRMGTNGTTADGSIGSATTMLNAATRSNGFWFRKRMASATSVQSLGSGNHANNLISGTSGSAVFNAVTVPDVTTQATALTITTTMSGTTDAPQAGYCFLEVAPS